MAERVVLTTEQVRRLDRIAIEEYGVPGVVLMENAGRGAAEVALEMSGGSTGPVLILCGGGNNGGDGFVVARHLHNRGVRAEIALACAPDKVGGDAGVNLRIVERMGLSLRVVADAASAAALDLDGYALIVDALLGTGLSGEVREPARTLIVRVNEAHAEGTAVLALDTPSGLDTDTGRVLGEAVCATRTATFAAAKTGFFLGEGPARTGRVHVVDIGCPREVLDRVRGE